MNKIDTVKMIAMLRDLWPNFDPSETFPDTALGFVSDLPGPLVRSAIQRLAMTHSDFAPGIGLIRKTAIEMQGESEGTAAPDNDIAWEEVQRQIRTVGRAAGHVQMIGRKAYRNELKWSHPAIGEAVSAFGWLRLCDSTDPMADRAHFLRFYEMAKTRHLNTAVATPTMTAIATTTPKALT